MRSTSTHAGNPDKLKERKTKDNTTDMTKKGTNIVHTRYEYLPEFGTFLRVGDGLVGSSEFQQRKLFPFFQMTLLQILEPYSSRMTFRA